jgi:hypothetical protein
MLEFFDFKRLQNLTDRDKYASIFKTLYIYL